MNSDGNRIAGIPGVAIEGTAQRVPVFLEVVKRIGGGMGANHSVPFLLEPFIEEVVQSIRRDGQVSGRIKEHDIVVLQILFSEVFFTILRTIHSEKIAGNADFGDGLFCWRKLRFGTRHRTVLETLAFGDHQDPLGLFLTAAENRQEHYCECGRHHQESLHRHFESSHREVLADYAITRNSLRQVALRSWRLCQIEAEYDKGQIARRQIAVKRKCIDFSVYLSVRAVICFLQCLRMETCEELSRFLAWLAWDIIKIRRTVIRENLQAVFPHASPADLGQLARRMWKHLFLMVCEIAQIQRKMHVTNWSECVTFHQRREIVRCLLDPRPKVLVSGHFGNFEIASYLAGLFGFRTYAIARPLDNPYLDRYVNAFREAKGQFIVDKDGSANFIAEILASGETLSLLGDQHAGPKGCWTEFLGRPASCHKAVALFTLTSNAPMMVMTCTRRDRPLQFEFGMVGKADPQHLTSEQASVLGLTRWYNEMLAQAIYRYPDQYWWVHRRWKDKPPTRKSRARAA